MATYGRGAEPGEGAFDERVRRTTRALAWSDLLTTSTFTRARICQTAREQR